MRKRAIRLFVVLVAVHCLAYGARFNPYQEAKSADKGPYPWEYETLVKQFVSDVFYDPTSLIDFEMTKPSASWWRDPGLGRAKNRTTFCWGIIFTANAKNRMGGYVGKKAYALYIRDARILGHEEIPWNPRTEATFNQMKSQGETDFKEAWEALSPEERDVATQLAGNSTTGQEAKPGKASYIEELKELAALKEQGVITEDEFHAKKRKILGLEDAPAPEKPPAQ
jgi:hypothetical protein